MKSLHINEIKEILPHRHPFLLLDRIEDYEPGQYAIGYKCVTYREDFFAGHFPQEPVMPGVLIIEALAQTGAVAILSQPENKGKIAFFGGIEKCRFRGKVVPGDMLRLETKIIKQKGPVGIGEATASVDGKVVASGQLTFMIGQIKMIKKLLVANRGEIAVRIIRACREMGIETVAIYSEADREALHAKLADEAVCIGPAALSESYLSMERIISATIVTGAQAIHPGFGFLSENAKFAALCEKCNIIFVGPKAETIERLGNKQLARETMQKAGVPVIPGSDRAVFDYRDGLQEAEKIGYPIMIKAALGGGGKGMRLSGSKEDFEKNFRIAQAEAKQCFGDDAMYLEHYIKGPRHVEFQILADSHGNVVHLGERDCSIQRKHQKLIEEAPCSVLSSRQRMEMGQTAVRAAKAAGYINAGTIEFLLEPSGTFYFMEMNTRIQVEHPITEWITGIDLIKEQIRIAAGEKLTFSQKDIRINGHAIEVRINAEKPEEDFRPCPGTITGLHLPGGKGIRIDSAIYSGYKIPPFYDSMIAKISVWAKTREEAIRKAQSALGEVIIEGVDTNVDYQYGILEEPDYRDGNVDINYIENHF